MKERRTNKKDVWKSWLCDGAIFSENDIPFCPTTAVHLPTDIITWEQAKACYYRSLKEGIKQFSYPAYVSFFLDDYKFDGKRGIWNEPNTAVLFQLLHNSSR